MSGGSLNYFYSSLQEHTGDFRDKELDELVKDLAELFHDREWYLSSDTGEGDWIEAKNAFKEKWFTKHGRQKRIEKYLAQLTDEIREEFGLKKSYCKTCRHWEAEEKDSRYGRCEHEEYCLMHRFESCEKYCSKDEG